MFRFTTVVVFLCLASGASAQSWCANGSLNPTEQTICATPDLGWRDQQLEQAYSAVRHIPGVQSAQLGWLAGRDACGWNVDCIRRAYDARIAALQAISQGAGGTGKPDPQPGPVAPVRPAWCAETSLNAAEQTICDYSDLGQMDLYMADLYAQVRHFPGVPAAQRDWLQARNACHASHA